MVHIGGGVVADRIARIQAEEAALASRPRSQSPTRAAFNPISRSFNSTTAAKQFQLPTRNYSRTAFNRSNRSNRSSVSGLLPPTPSVNRNLESFHNTSLKQQASKNTVLNSSKPIYEGDLEIEVKGRFYGTNWESRHFVLYPDRLDRKNPANSRYLDTIMLKDIVTVIYDFKKNDKAFVIILLR